MAKIPPQFVKKPAGGKPASGGAKTKVCPRCGDKMPMGAKSCPSCGKKMG